MAPLPPSSRRPRAKVNVEPGLDLALPANDNLDAGSLFSSAHVTLSPSEEALAEELVNSFLENILGGRR